jgi:hypothetical protein
MLRLLKTYLPLSLAGLFYYGSASRLTNGATSTATFYAYQNARKPNDGTMSARILPVVDILFAVAIQRRGRSRTVATSLVALSFVGVMIQRMSEGLSYQADALQAIWAVATAIVVWI